MITKGNVYGWTEVKRKTEKAVGDVMASYLWKVGVSEVYIGYRIKWKCKTIVADPKQWEEKAKKKKN